MYLDPGFGSMVIQVVVAGIAAVGAYLFIIRNKIKSLFSKKKDSAADAGADAETDTGTDAETGTKTSLPGDKPGND